MRRLFHLVSASGWRGLRGLRALAAVGLLAGLVTIFFVEQHAREQLRQATLETAMGMNWRLNDVIVEALTLRHHVDGLVLPTDLTPEARAERFAALRLRYEILWSNVIIARETDLELYEDFKSPLKSLEDYLVAQEDVMFEGPVPDRERLVEMGREVQAHGMALQRAWQDTRYFSVEMFLGREAEQTAHSDEVLRRVGVLVMILLLTVFLFVEAYLAGKMRRSQARLAAAARSASEASEAKSVFLANVSHEIRTPLNGILGMAAELGETALDADQRACLDVISHAGDVLLHTLNDVLDLSKVESGQLELETRDFDLHALLDAAVALHRPLAEGKGLGIRLLRAPETPRFVSGDSQRLSQVLHNLLGNAIKFTETGRVTVRAGRAPGTDGLCLSVSDTGRGIAPELQDRIFEPFLQADGSITRTFGGTGLGLSISRALASAMGGDLRVVSREGEGATFHVTLRLPDAGTPQSSPGAPAEQAPPAAPTAAGEARPGAAATSDADRGPDVRPLRVLVVDDNATNRILLRRYLRHLPARIEEARDGAEAVDAVTADGFDVVLMDVQMPVMDGIAATAIIRAREAALGRSPTRIIAITANVMTHQVASYLQSGVDDVLAKPVAKSDLIAMLEQSSRNAA